MERKFNQPQTTTDADTEFNPEAMDELGTTQALATRANMALGQISGELDAKDFRVPRLDTAYGVGQYVGKFAAGSLILGKDHLLVQINEPLRIVILSAIKYWKEYISNDQWGAGIRPRQFATEEEVKAAGGTIDWGPNNERPSYGGAMDAKILIQKPDAITCGMFGVEIEGKLWAPAIWTVDKLAYRRAGTAILSAAAFALKARGLLSGLFEVKNTIEKVNGKNTVVPNVRLVSHNSVEFIEAVGQVFGRK